MKTLLLAALLPLSTLAVAADQGAFDYLQSMNQAARKLNYEGTFVYVHDGRLESMKILHRADGDGEWERVFHLNGSPREVIRENDVVTCILPDHKSVVINKSQGGSRFFSQLPHDTDRLSRYYTVSLDGGERIAARNGRMITVKPRDKLRYGYRLWVDEKTFLLLKSELLDEAGKVIEQVMFTELDVVDDIPMQSLRSDSAHANFVRHEDMKMTESVDEKDQHWRITSLPSGFEYTSHKKQRSGNNGHEGMHHLVISDGLASVSVYIEKLDDDGRKFLGSSYMGAVNVFGSVLGNHQITVVGEVPRETVRMVADAIEYRQ